MCPSLVYAFVRPRSANLGGGELGSSDDQFQAMQPHGLTVLADWSCDDPNPAGSSDGGPDLDIEGEPAPFADRIAAQFLQRGSGLFTVERDCFIATDRRATRKSKDVVDAAGPGQRVVGQIAFPAARMMDAERTNRCRPDDIGDGAIQDEAEVEVSRLLAKRPTLEQRRR